MLTESIYQAFQAIRSNLLRAILTLMIIAFGIMALVGILTSIDAIKSTITNNFASMGTNTFNIIRKGSGIRGGRRGKRRLVSEKITYRQAVAFKRKFDFPASVSISAIGTTSATVLHNKNKTSPNVTIQGGDENYLPVSGYSIAAGRNISPTESFQGTSVAILGKVIADNLFPNYPYNQIIGKSVKIKNSKFKVIGILEEKGSSLNFNGDRMVIIPIQALRMYYGSFTDSYNISVMVSQSTEMQQAISNAFQVFRGVRKIRPGKESDFEVQKSDGLIDIIVENTRTIQLAAIFIGLITLFGAAIGLMNIMLVSVTERTREVGICKSLGATKRNIISQFLIEALVICQLGGIVGIILGILAGNVVTTQFGGDFIIPWTWITLGISLCFAVGLLAGLYPAVKAANLDPIESLRYE